MTLLCGLWFHSPFVHSKNCVDHIAQVLSVLWPISRGHRCKLYEHERHQSSAITRVKQSLLNRHEDVMAQFRGLRERIGVAFDNDYILRACSLRPTLCNQSELIQGFRAPVKP